MADTTDIWAANPELKRAVEPAAGEPRWRWDDDKATLNCALRSEASAVVLVVVRESEYSWGIYQPRYRGSSFEDMDLIQIRGGRDEARACAVEMARRTGWIE